ncbi:heat shock factor protein 1-like [Gracilinanus agilis]|uniref:heat shock factor protein 1-like n=1 Tax=Gracilinanus agilis TaxID=191870 RepID=UPI001CFDEA14|nr:heat shock factor protein 1-like [Gracilinanus agilis]
MEKPGASGHAGPLNVPAFLTKLWTLVSDPDTDALIAWSPSGRSFHVFDPGQFAQEVLPKYFKHNHMASFIRQLNMYGFRKVVHVQPGPQRRAQRDLTEFQHPDFLRGHEQLLENIKRKVTNVPGIKTEDLAAAEQDSVAGLGHDVRVMKAKQECMDLKLDAIKQENEALWRELTTLQRKQAQQQKVVNKLTQFLISLVQPNQLMGLKRKVPLMLDESSLAHSPEKCSCPDFLDNGLAAHDPGTSSLDDYDPSLFSAANIASISLADLPQFSSLASTAAEAGMDPNESNLMIHIKEEPPSPPIRESSLMEEASPEYPTDLVMPLSPNSFISSFLQEDQPHSVLTAYDTDDDDTPSIPQPAAE